MQTKVYLLLHSYLLNNMDETKYLGLYSSKESVDNAIDTYRQLKGFCDWPDNFFVTEFVIDEMEWRKGFILSSDEKI